ncbi:MAG: exodeoxyribonuclease VII small subunit [Chitinispirillaceae bacterium]|nr:exodeoxyribonuclease VII small subunit [Chitinispirillaceae bacterium]
MAEKTRSSKPSDPARQPSFETALKELEAIIDRLETPDLNLDESLALFEKGITLIRICDAHLKSAQGRVKELLAGEHGTFIEKTLSQSLESFLSYTASSDERSH